MTASKLVRKKADRLLIEGRIEPDAAPARVFRIVGEHGRYTVVIGAHIRTCTCPHGQRSLAGQAAGVCAHIEAAITWVLAQADRDLGREDREIARYESALTARKAREHREGDELFRRLGSS